MKKLNSITIMGRKVKIQYKKTDNLCGEFDGDKNLITIDKNVLTDPELFQSTLFHECTHAILFYSGLNELLKEDTEEALVRCIEYNLLPIMKKLHF